MRYLKARSVVLLDFPVLRTSPGIGRGNNKQMFLGKIAENS